MPLLPVVSLAVIESQVHSFATNAQKTEEILKLIQRENPVLYVVLKDISQRQDDPNGYMAGFCLMYNVLHNQAEVDELEATA